MPKTRRERGPRRRPTSFAEIGTGELVRWLGTGPIVGSFTSVPGLESPPNVQVWPDFATWAATYASCRADFLEFVERRFPGRVAGAELVHTAFLEGGETLAWAVQARIVREEEANDPRRVWKGGK